MRRFLRPTTRTKMADFDRLLRSALFDAQETLIRIRLQITATHRLVLLWTHSRTTLEREGGQAPFRGHNKNVLSTVLLAHVTLRLVELVVGTADEASTVLVALGLTVCRHNAILQGHGDHSQATGFLLQLAHALVRVSVRPTNGRQLLVLGCAFGGAVTVILAEASARPNVR